MVDSHSINKYALYMYKKSYGTCDILKSILIPF